VTRPIYDRSPEEPVEQPDRTEPDWTEVVATGAPVSGRRPVADVLRVEAG
jgi:hypothetical protein